MRSAIEVKEDVQLHHTDEDGQVTVDRDPSKWSTGNGLMHLGLFIAFLSYLKILYESDKEDVNAALEACEKEPGNYNRNPGRGDLIAQDDLEGVAVADILTGDGKRIDEILWYGIKHFLFWNNTDKFTINAFRGRTLSFMLFLLAGNSSILSYAFKPLTWLWFRMSDPKDYHALLNFMMLESLAARSRMFVGLRDRRAKSDNLVTATSMYFGSEHSMVDLAKLVAA